ncbi:MAG: LPS export ABC transporter ATP-binding protein [Ruminobacter sp.]|nr:LPS export ABC transporter ATP-binding protein [Ruminobacter sp.]
MALLKATELVKQYKNRIVVNNVNLEVKTGQIVGLLGPNGAGKTTSFYMIVGIVKVDQGSIFIDDENITHKPMDKRAQLGLGYLPQEASIWRKLTVKENLMGALQLNKKIKSRKERKDRMYQLLNEFRIEHIANNTGMSLSGGERRRVEIARALASDPKFILLDEPFAGVDPISVNEIKNIIKQLKNRGLGVLITDHNVRETLDVCEHAYIVNKGTMIAQGEPSTILNNELVKSVYLGENFTI